MSIKIGRCLVFLLAGAAVSGAAAEDCPSVRPDGCLKVLMIGNSFSLSVTNQLPKVAAALGRDLDLASLYISGCDLETHARNVRKDGDESFCPYQYDRFVRGRQIVCHGRINVGAALRAAAWDVVTLQQASHLSWKPESYEPFLGELVRTIRRRAPQAKLYLQETWSYTPWDGRLKEWGFDAAELSDRIHATCASMAAKYGMGVIGMGPAVQAWRRQLPVRYAENSFGGDVVGGRFKKPQDCFVLKDGKWTVACDVFHLNERGKYLQALVWANCLLGADLHGLSYRPDCVTADEARLMRTIALTKGKGDGK